MKKKRITLLISVIVVLLLCAAAIFLLKTAPADDSDSSSESESASIISSDSTVEYIDIENESGSYSIVVDEDASAESEESTDESGSVDSRQWKIEKLNGISQTQSMYSDIVSLMTNLSADLTLDSPGELSVYGLDDASKVTAYYEDGTSLTLLIGNLNPDESGYYCKLSDSDTICIVSAANGEILLRSTLDYIDLTVTPTIETVTYTTIESSSDDESEEAESTVESTLNVSNITIKRDGYEDVEFTSLDNALTKDGAEIDNDLSSELLSAISGITADSVVSVFPTDSQKDFYGFNNSKATISYTVNGETYTLVIGNGIESETDESQDLDVAAGIGSYYVMVEGTDVVFVVSKDYIPWLSMDLD